MPQPRTDVSNALDFKSMDRRSFLKTGLLVAGCLVLPVSLRTADATDSAEAKQGMVEITDWIRIGPDGTTVLGLSQAEVGQGVWTGLPQVLADEMDADWNRVRVEFVTARDAYRTAAAHEKLQQFVGGSTSVTMFYQRLRIAGAQARRAFVQAAALRWGVAPSQCTTQKGQVLHATSQRSLSYAELIADAAKIPLEPNPTLKADTQQNLVNHWLPKLDTPQKCNGSAVFGIDVQVPDMLNGSIRTAPTLGGKPVKVNNQDAIRQRPGVHAVVMAKDVVIVVAETFWIAKQACDALDVEWEESDASLNSGAIAAEVKAALDAKDSPIALKQGDPLGIIGASSRVIQAEYHVPYIVHATMEPVNATVHVREGEVEVWGPIQGQDLVRWTLGDMFKIPAEKVIVNTTFLGGSFGRKYVPDFVIHAAVASAAVGKPVKVLRTREDDLRHGFYRPNVSGRLKAALDKDGNIAALQARLAGQSLYYQIKRANFDGNGGWDETMVDGIYNAAYQLPNLQVESTNVIQNIPVSFMRSVGSTGSVFMYESFISELADAAGVEQTEFRRRMLQHDPTSLAVIDHTLKRADWTTPPADGLFRGFAFSMYVGRANAYRSYAAVVAEIRIKANGRFKVERLVCGVDCGRPINQNLISSMVEGSMGFALTNTFKSKITFEGGAVVQGNFPDYRLLFLREMPHVEVEIIDSQRPPQGLGEITMPPVAPAVAQALYQATKIRLRSLPLPGSLAEAQAYAKEQS
ncbi:molybdopterin cofactor-binding domain-containing protein [Pseudomonas sp. YH-1]|uniref:xanthine dehydrogenase family protein molybdopterin-binding subunit n=1 Tax=Pseudomonas sp. YH-1 TaxID=3384787 RepID=UPI003F801388